MNVSSTEDASRSLWNGRSSHGVGRISTVDSRAPLLDRVDAVLEHLTPLGSGWRLDKYIIIIPFLHFNRNVIYTNKVS